MRRMPFYLLALMAAIGWCTVVRAAPGDDSGGFTIAPDKDEPLKIEGEDVVPGDGSRFHIRTDDNIEKLKEDDVYSSGLNTMFKVVAIVEKGTTGGSFTVSRLRGNSNPDRKFNRISGNGPLTIVVTQTLLDLYKAGGPFLHPLAVLGV